MTPFSIGCTRDSFDLHCPVCGNAEWERKEGLFPQLKCTHCTARVAPVEDECHRCITLVVWRP